MRKIVKLVKELLFKLGLDKSVNFLINSGIVGKIHILLERLDTKSFREFYSMHMKEFEEVESILEDDLSIRTYKAVIHYRCSGKREELLKCFVKPQYFQKDIFTVFAGDTFIDGGAFIGDVTEQVLRCVGGYSRIYAWEPDRKNIEILNKIIENHPNVKNIPYALWSEKTTLYFSEEGTAGSKVVANHESTVKTISLEANSIDNVHVEDKVSFIKMDIEGAEMYALKGAEHTIMRDRPNLAICIYHSFEDLYRIPLYIKSLVPEYKIYIRHHSDRSIETVVYATL